MSLRQTYIEIGNSQLSNLKGCQQTQYPEMLGKF